MTYLDPDLVDDEQAVAEAVLAQLADRLGLPDRPWTPDEHNVETAQAEAVATVAATIAALVRDRERDEFTSFGENVLLLPRGTAQVAATIATFTLTSNAGGRVPAGFALTLVNPLDGQAYDFATTRDAVVPPGEAVAADVPVQALDAGPEPNGCVGAPIDRDDLAVVADVQVLVSAAGGADEEPLERYAPKVLERARRTRALPITPEDHAALALDVAWVARAFAVNRRAPASMTADAPGHVMVYAVGEQGDPGTVSQLAELQAYLDAEETVRGTVPHAAAPGTVDVAVAVTFRKRPGFTDAEAEAAVTAAVLDRRSRARWARDDQRAGGFAAQRPSKLTVYDVAAAVDDLPQLDAVVTVTLNGATAPVDVPATAVARAFPVTSDAVA